MTGEMMSISETVLVFQDYSEKYLARLTPEGSLGANGQPRPDGIHNGSIPYSRYTGKTCYNW